MDSEFIVSSSLNDLLIAVIGFSNLQVGTAFIKEKSGHCIH